jgi:glycerol-3-phosphate dehydrogenase subunit B
LVEAPLELIASAPPGHPYRSIGAENVRDGIGLLLELLGEGWLEGTAEHNVLVPTALGALRPTALYPPSMAAGRPTAGSRWALIGFDRVKDFYPALAAGNLNRTRLADGGKLQVSAHMLALPFDSALGAGDVNAMAVARAFDNPAFAARVAAAIKPLVKEATAVGVPAVLGTGSQTPWTTGSSPVDAAHSVWAEFERAVGKPVFEIALPPPSLPGSRLAAALMAQVRALGVRLCLGTAVTGFDASADRVSQLTTNAAGADRTYPVQAVVYCPGGFEAGGIVMDSFCEIAETLFGLPLAGLKPIDELIVAEYSPAQAVFKAGLRVDGSMRPTDQAGRPAYSNLYAAGAVLGGSVRWDERTGDGIALGSAAAAASAVLECLR